MTSPFDELKAISSYREPDEEVDLGSSVTSVREEEGEVPETPKTEPKPCPAPNPFVEHGDVNAPSALITSPLPTRSMSNRCATL